MFWASKLWYAKMRNSIFAEIQTKHGITLVTESRKIRKWVLKQGIGNSFQKNCGNAETLPTQSSTKIAEIRKFTGRLNYKYNPRIK